MTRKLGLLFDTHVTDGRRSEDGVSQTKTAIDQLNSVGVDHTLHGGDLRPLGSVSSSSSVDWHNWDGGDNPFYESDFGVIKDLMENRLNSDYYVIRGNHDRPEQLFREYFPSGQYSPSDDNGRTDSYWGVETVNGVRYVYLDSNIGAGEHVLNQTENFVSSQQLSMLDRLADADSSIPTFVFIHCPIETHSGLSYDWNTQKAMMYELVLNRASVRSRLERMNTKIVHYGHVWEDGGRDATKKNGIVYSIGRHLVHNSDSSYAGDVRWLEVDESAGSADLKYYDVGADSQGTLTSVTF